MDSSDVPAAHGPILIEVHADGEPATVVLELAGEIDQRNAGEFVAAAQPWIRAGVASLTLDMAEVVFIDSGGIGRIVNLWKQGKAVGLPVRLTAAHEAVLALLELTGLDRFMDVAVVPVRVPTPRLG